jgi:tRNA-splicing ligase RtcB
VACHFGSRGFGHKTATGFMNVARGRAFDDRQGEGSMDAPPLLLESEKPSGQDYIAAMTIAGQYAYAGREAVIDRVMGILGAEARFTVHNHHNFAWRETHGHQSYWVVRKGATPAFPGQWGFVGGSMGDISVVLRGVDGSDARSALYSTVHGAGRVMSRTQAAGKLRMFRWWTCGNRDCRHHTDGFPLTRFARGEQQALPRCPACGGKLRKSQGKTQLRSGAVDFAAVQAEMRERGTILRGAGADEAPQVYRSLGSVLGAHANTIEIVHTLRPRIVVMAGSEEHDPYKD